MFGFIDSILRNTVKLGFLIIYYLSLITINILALPLVLTRHTRRFEVGIVSTLFCGLSLFVLMLIFQDRLAPVLIFIIMILYVVINLILAYSAADKEE